MPLSQDTLRFIREHRRDDVRSLALQARRYPSVDMPAAITQISGWQIAKEKIPAWAENEHILYPAHLSLEQCSSQATAQYKAEIITNLLHTEQEHPAQNSTPTSAGTFTDLTGGFGIDCAYLSSRFGHATYVERQETLCQIAAHNFPVLGLNHISVCHADSVRHLQEMEPVDCIFIDPARRDGHGGKTVAIGDCEPDIAALEELLLRKARHVLVKLSPMLDLTLALNDLKHVREAHIVSVGNECKELPLVLGRPAQVDARDGVDGAGSHRRPAAHAHMGQMDIRARQTSNDKTPLARTRVEQMNGGMDLADTVGSFDGESKAERTVAASHDGRYAAPHVFCVNDDQRIDYDSAAYTQGLRIGGKPLPEAKNYLYEPNASIMKAGCFDLVEERFGVTQIGPSSHLFVSEQQIADFPGRGFAIEAVGSMNKKDIKRLLNGAKQANIAVRNFPLTAPQLRKKLKLADGGTVYLFGTTMQGGDHVLLRTSKI